MFLIVATHGSRRESFSIPLAVRLLSFAWRNSLIEIPERMAHQITRRTRGSRDPNRGKSKIPDGAHAGKRDNLTPWTGRRHGPSTPCQLELRFIVVCPYGTRHQSIHHCNRAYTYRNVNETCVEILLQRTRKLHRLLFRPDALPSCSFRVAFAVIQDVR